jgi:hypothetical protein
MTKGVGGCLLVMRLDTGRETGATRAGLPLVGRSAQTAAAGGTRPDQLRPSELTDELSHAVARQAVSTIRLAKDVMGATTTAKRYPRPAGLDQLEPLSVPRSQPIILRNGLSSCSFSQYYCRPSPRPLSWIHLWPLGRLALDFQRLDPALWLSTKEVERQGQIMSMIKSIESAVYRASCSGTPQPQTHLAHPILLLDRDQ